VRYVEVGGLRLSAVGLGTWQFGSKDWGYGEGYATEVAPAIVRRALELGINFFDTAEAYAWGRSERILGAALADRRSEAFIATKLLPVLPLSPIVQRRARSSAERLGIESIDLYQMHWPNPAVPIANTMSAFSQLLDSGLIRHAGVSNFSLERWRKAEGALGRPVLSNQVRLSLLYRRAERELLPWAQANDRLVIAYSPLAQGLLSGRFRPGEKATGTRARTPAFQEENVRRARPLLDALQQVAEAHGCTSAQVALAWLIRRPNVLVIPGASSVAQLEANAEAADLSLSDEEDAALVEAADAYTPLAGRELVSTMTRAQIDHLGGRLKKVSDGLKG